MRLLAIIVVMAVCVQVVHDATRPEATLQTALALAVIGLCFAAEKRS